MNIVVQDYNKMNTLTESKEAKLIKFKGTTLSTIKAYAAKCIQEENTKEVEKSVQAPVQEKIFEVLVGKTDERYVGNGDSKKIKLPAATFNSVKSLGKFEEAKEEISIPTVSETEEEVAEVELPTIANENVVDFSDKTVESEIEEKEDVEEETAQDTGKVENDVVEEKKPLYNGSFKTSTEVPRIVSDEARNLAKQIRSKVNAKLSDLEEQAATAKEDADKKARELEEEKRAKEEAIAAKEKLEEELAKTKIIFTSEIERVKREMEEQARKATLDVLNELSDLAKEDSKEEEVSFGRAA